LEGVLKKRKKKGMKVKEKKKKFEKKENKLLENKGRLNYGI